ncbi:NTE family protein [Persephonella hydrogeniphila]|uniref:NTE family protein n=1 Tax=Persephonella hydrogeniphila TaxID=198703 RepID=A0A285N0Q0_9AQUI|nr:patatin-like phospholipase family protein [Persephonella hydrogeniphila]SNZ02908.1 NTE family protein [Persephonella hydrogeniphila]
MEKKFGIALSGGAVRGAAHIGVLKALKEFGIKPSIITGASAGSIIAVFYASGYDPVEMEEIILKTNVLSYIKPALNFSSLFTLEKMEDFFDKYIDKKDLKELDTPVFVCATNLNLGVPEYFSTGNIHQIVSASCALPFIFRPVKIGDYLYIDGGVMDNLPVEPLIGEVDFIIGSEVNPLGKEENLSNPFSILLRSFYLAVRANVEARKKYCHLFIQPPELLKIGIFSTWKLKEAIDIGYRYTKKIIQKELSI